MIERPAAPQRPPRREWFAPAVVAGSLLIHAAIVAPLVWAPRAEAARPPAEIPVEVVQLPPEPEKPKPPQAKPPARQAKPLAAQAKPPAAPAKPPAAPAKPAPQAKPPAPQAKAPEAKPPEPKPSVPKPSEPKHSPSKSAEKDHAAKPAKAPEKSVTQRMAQLIGPMPAMAMPALASGDNPLDDTISYQQLILSRVAKQKRDDRHDGIPGHAVITFAVGDNGEVVTCEVREKSGDPNLDAEGKAMVYRGAPYPPPPPGAPRQFSFGLAFHTL